LTQGVKTAQQNLESQRARLASLTQAVESGSAVVSVQGSEYTLAQAKANLASEFAACKRCESDLKSREKLLAQKQKAVNVAEARLNTLAGIRQDFEVCLATLEAREQELQLKQATTPEGVDPDLVQNTRALLERIRRAQEVKTVELDLAERHLQAVGTSGLSPAVPPVNLDEIQTYLRQGAAPPKVASGN